MIQQHGGALEFGPGPLGVDTAFRVTLAVPRQAESGETLVSTLAALILIA